MSTTNADQVISILTAQTELLERQTLAHQKAAEEYAKQAIECEKLKVVNERLDESNKENIRKAERHISVHEQQTKEVLRLIEAINTLLIRLEETYAEQLAAFDRLILVIGLLFNSQSLSMAKDTKEQISALMDAIKTGLNKSSISMKTELSSDRDIVVGRDMNVGE